MWTAWWTFRAACARAGSAAAPRAPAGGWIAPGALGVAEVAKAEPLDAPGFETLAERAHGAARVVFLKAS
jgi:hypothetical protein